MKKNDVIQFNEKHKWCGTLGIIDEVRGARYLVGVPMPRNDGGKTTTAYILADKDELEHIGIAVFIPNN